MWNGLNIPFWKKVGGGGSSGALTEVLAGNNVFVSSTGDNATAQLQDFAHQFLTLEAAITAAKAGTASNYTIWVYDGTHNITQTLNSTSKNLNYVICPNATVTQTSGDTINQGNNVTTNILGLLGSVLNVGRCFVSRGNLYITADTLNSTVNGQNIFEINTSNSTHIINYYFKINKVNVTNNNVILARIVYTTAGSPQTGVFEILETNCTGTGFSYYSGDDTAINTGKVTFLNCKTNTGIIRSDSDFNEEYINCELTLTSYSAGTGSGNKDITFKNTSFYTNEINFNASGGITMLLNGVNKFVCSNAQSFNNSGVGIPILKNMGEIQTNKPFLGTFNLLVSGILTVDTNIE
jgi:hypothetical protein